MRGRFAIIATTGLVLALLVALNAASYVQVERPPDSEFEPNRSTFNAGATGTRALYDFLHETGYRVVRWRERLAVLLDQGRMPPATLVVIGPLRLPVRVDEAQSIAQWVKQGGRLIVIDRRPDALLLPAEDGWRIFSEVFNRPSLDDRSGDMEAMTADTSPFAPTQPTLLAEGVERVQPSRWAGRLYIDDDEQASNEQSSDEQASEAQTPAPDDQEAGMTVEAAEEEASSEASQGQQSGEGSSASASSSDESPGESAAVEVSAAPVVHFSDNQGALLVDYAYGRGRIAVLSDPFIISNAGISSADNLQLAVNLIVGPGGLIAFDEWHQGYGAARSPVVDYFAGTPLIAFSIQAAIIVLAVLWTRGRRWARPLPAPRTTRVSNLEFVSSMAELQQRSRAYDLAIENVYSRVRRALARFSGTDANAPLAEIAGRVAARSTLNQQELTSLMQACEDAMTGQPLSAGDALNLVARLREVEHILNLQHPRSSRQALLN